MERSVDSISNSISKGSLYEETSMFRASMDDAASRLAEGIKQDVISNEKIQNGDEILETYRVTSDAIHGGMGSVWRVHHKHWNTDLAMKRPQPRFFSEGSNKRKEEFIAECENWISLGLHPNIVSCYYVRDIGGVPSVFSEWMDNGSLKDRILDQSLYEDTEEQVQERIMNIAIQAARGLLYSHGKGLIHQDVKPGNILLTKKWEVKVADFGLAKAESSLLGEPGVSKTSGYTPAYCPQEQIERREPAKWMDAYAWALTVLEMYAGSRPWETGPEVAREFDDLALRCKHTIPGKMRELLHSCVFSRNDEMDFSFIVSEIEKIWQELFGKQYPQDAYSEKSLVSAVNLNNYALSMIDMGKKETADAFFRQSMALQPDLVSARINHAFYSKKNGTMTYEEILRIFQNLPDSKEKDEAIRTLITEHFALKEITPLSGRNYKFNSSAWFDSSGYLWLLNYEWNGCTLFRYDGKTGTEPELVGGRSNYNAMIMDSDGRYLYAVHMGSPFCDSVSCIDTTTSHIETTDVSDMDSIDNYRKKNGVFGADHRGKCLAVWMENNDQTLCILEDNQWKDQGGDFFSTYSYAEYDVTDKKQIRMKGERKHLGEYTGKYQQYKTYEPYQRYLEATRKRTEKLKSYHDDAVAVNFTGDRVLLNGGIGIVKTDTPTLYSTYPEQDRNHVYILNRFSDAVSVKEWVEERTDLLNLFRDAVGQENYSEAIRIFEEYRELPEQRDAAATVEMEKTLAAVCRRTRFHHSIETAEHEFDPGKEPFFKSTEFDWSERLGKISKKNKPDGFPDSVFDAVIKASKQVSLSLHVLKTDSDGKYTYIQFGSAVARLDVMTGELRFIANFKENTFPAGTLISPNTKVIAGDTSYMTNEGSKKLYYLYDGTNKFGWNVLDGEDLSTHIRFSEHKETDVIETRDGLFSPDSRFFMWRDPKTNIYCISGLQEKGTFAQVFDSSELQGRPCFSKDGFFLAVRAGDGTILKAFRMSYCYEYQGRRDWDDEADIFARQFLFENPSWDEKQLDRFMEELRDHGLGFLRKEGVRRKLTEMSQSQKKKNGLLALLKKAKGN